ncbi:MAG: hypothetical protein KAQ91_05540 [Methylococcales bacterium]|nr:hypothetical protein [Methylococcales bacterium]
MKYWGLLILALWLIIQGVLDLTNLHFPYEKLVMSIMALVAGLVLFLHAVKTKLSDVGLLLLGIWLVLRSSLFLFHFTFPYSDMTIAILGIVAGVLLLIRM